MTSRLGFSVARVLTIIYPLLLLSSALADVGLCVIAALFLLHSHRARDWNWLKEPWVQALGLLWLFMTARGLFAPHPQEAMARSLPFIRYVVFAAALARWTLADVATRRRFLAVLCGFVVICAGDGLLQYILGYDAMLHPLIHDPNAGHIRLNGPFTRPILGIMLAWLAFPALLPMACAAKNKMPVLLAIAAVLAAIALSGERMALLLTLSGLVLCVFFLRFSWKRVCAAGAVTALLLIALALLSPALFHRQVASTADTLSHFGRSPYGLLLASDMTLAKAHPVAGIGVGGFREACEALYPGDALRVTSMCNTHPHNIYFEWMIEEGAIGLGLFVLAVACIFMDSARAYQRDDPTMAGLLIALILRLWPLMSTTDFFSRWGAPPFWLVLGALLVYTAGKEDKNAGAAVAFQDARL